MTMDRCEARDEWSIVDGAELRNSRQENEEEEEDEEAATPIINPSGATRRDGGGRWFRVLEGWRIPSGVQLRTMIVEEGDCDGCSLMGLTKTSRERRLSSRLEEVVVSFDSSDDGRVRRAPTANFRGSMPTGRRRMEMMNGLMLGSRVLGVNFLEGSHGIARGGRRGPDGVLKIRQQQANGLGVVSGGLL